jgi:hypothetical protein
MTGQDSIDRTRLYKILISVTYFMFIEVDESEEFLGAVAKLRM